jgi:hypothetical protein
MSRFSSLAVQAARWRLMLPTALVFAATYLSPSQVFAHGSGSEQQRMTHQMEDYFGGEKAQAYVFLGMGVAALGAGAFLYSRTDRMARGASYPVLAIGLLQAAVGTGLILRTDGQIAERRIRIDQDLAGFRRDERERMEGVMSRFKVALYTELGVGALGLGLLAYGARQDRSTLKGIGLGLALQSTAMLGLDYFAAQRGQRYLDAIHGFALSASPGGVSVGWAAAF